MRGFVRQHWRLVAGAAVVVLLLAVGGGLQAYRAHASHRGPLTVANVNSFGTIPRGHPVVAVIPVVVDPAQAAVIDWVHVRGGDARRSPEILTVVGDRDTNCAGIWWPVQGPFRGTFFSRCAPHGTIPVIGHPIQVAKVTTDASTGSASGVIDLALEIAPAGTGHCWVIGGVTIGYHVGSRHYTAVSGESLTGCSGPTNLGRPTTAPLE
jgi:hypothetical protein